VLSRLKTLARGFFAWWIGELLYFVPGAVRRQLLRVGQRSNLVLVLGPANAILVLEQGGRGRELARVDRAAAGARQALAGALRRGAFSWRKPLVCLRLPAEGALRNKITLPLVAEANLREVVAYELDRHTPFRVQDVHFAPYVTGKDGATQRLRVELTIMSRTAVDAALGAARALGFAPDRVEVDSGAPERPPSLLVLDEGAPPRRRFGRSADLALGVAALALAVIAFYLPFRAQEARSARLEDQFTVVKKKSADVKKAGGEIAALREDSTFLVNRKRRANVSEILAAITTVMPDETWLVEFQLSAAELQLAGFSASASDLIGLLEHTPIFRNTTFRSPVTQDPASQRERFHIAARVVSELDK
jgi:general secretion pathway protein L